MPTSRAEGTVPGPDAGDARRGLAWLLLAMVLAAALRLWGLRWGLPDETHLFSYHPDEYHSLRGALALSAGDPNPHFFNYGSLYLYLVALACQWHSAVLGAPDLLTSLVRGDAPHAAMAGWVLDARLVTALCAVATVPVASAIGGRVGGALAAAVAGLMVAILPLHALHSHYGTVDVTLGLCVAACLLASVRIQSGGEPRAYLAAGIAAGLAASVKYNGAVVLVAPLVAHLLAGSGNQASRAQGAAGWKGLLPLVGGAVVAFAATSPYVLLSWPEAWRDISYELDHMRAGESPVKEAYANGWLFHLHPSLVLGLAAVTFCSASQRRALLPLLAFGALWFGMIGASGVRYARYEIPLEPLSAVFCGLVVAAVAQRFVASARWPVLVLVAVWGASLLATTVRRDVVMASQDVRAEALSGVLDATPSGGSVGLVWPTWFSVPPLDYCNGGTGLRAHPLFARYQRPLRRLVTTGVSAEALHLARPGVVVVSDLDLDPRFERVSPAYRGLGEALRSGGAYRLVHTWAAGFPSDHPVLGWTATDSKYAAPTIMMYKREPDR